jgi:hypothetical protein
MEARLALGSSERFSMETGGVDLQDRSWIMMVGSCNFELERSNCVSGYAGLAWPGLISIDMQCHAMPWAEVALQQSESGVLSHVNSGQGQYHCDRRTKSIPFLHLQNLNGKPRPRKLPQLLRQTRDNVL